MGHARVPRAVAAGLLALLGPACALTTQSTRDTIDLRGQAVEVVAVWSGPEQEAFEHVLEAFERSTGAEVTYTSAAHGGVASALDARLAEGRAPDVAFLPQPGLLRRYARQGSIMALDDAVGELVEHNFGPVWRRLGEQGGRLYGVWFKAANKSLIWYDVAVFERFGLVPPDDVDGLRQVARTLAGSGVIPFAVGGADGWTLTDWFENLYIRTAGPERYDQLARHDLPWTDDSVKTALRLLDDVLDPGHIAGGVEGALATLFEPSVHQVFGRPGMAAMVFEGDFVAGVIRGETAAEIGVDADVFAFPHVGRSVPTETDWTGADTAVVGGGDAAVLFRSSAAGKALIQYLATPEAAGLWAARGGFLSPNRNLDLSVYPDDLTRSLARRLLEAGDAFRFDLSDLAPAAFGSTEGQGLRAALQGFLRIRDVDATAALLEAEATAAYAK